MKRKQYGFIILLWILLCLPRDGAGAVLEQMAVDTRASSLGNAITADPQGPIAVHYNPAGLDRIKGTEFDMTIFYVPVLNVKGHFTQGIDPATGKLWAPFGGWFNHGIDPEAGKDSSTEARIVLPFIGNIPIISPSNSFAHHSEGSPFAYGVAIYAPEAGGMEHTDPNDPYRFLGQDQSILRLVVGPGVSYRVTRNLSIGASIGLGQSYMAFNTRMRTPNDLVAMTGALGQATKGLEIPIISELTLPAPWFGGGLSPYDDAGGLKFFARDVLNTSYNVGFLWDPFSWVSFGGVYQSAATADMKGPYTFYYSPHMQRMINWLGSSPLTIIVASILGLPTTCPAEESGNMSISIVYPQRVQLGIKLQPHPRIKFLVDASWADWAAWKSTEIVFDRPMRLLQLARLMGYQKGLTHLTMPNNFKDVWYLSYGLELRPFDPITLRFGYEYRPTSVGDQYYGPITIGDMRFYSVGISIDHLPVPARKFKGFDGFQKQLLHPDRLDFSFTYMASDHEVKFNQSKLFNSTNFTDVIYNPFAGLEYQQKTTAYFISINQVFLF